MEPKTNLVDLVDVVIVGGGPAGQSAALLLGRCMRKVVIVDVSAGEMESDTTAGSTLDHDGSIPYEFRRADGGQLHKFKSVTHLRATVDDVERCRFGFAIHCSDGSTLTTRALLLASDLAAATPAIPGAEQFYGSSLHECPYCDGWEHRGRKIGVLGAGEAAVDLALKLLQWSPQVRLFPNGGMVAPLCKKRLETHRIHVVPGMVTALEGQGKNLEFLRIDDDGSHPCEALFFSSPRKYHSSLAARLGCDLERMSGAVQWWPDGDMVIEGLFVTGSAWNTPEITAIAASEGLKAAKAANDWLLEADRSYLAVTPVSSVGRGVRQSKESRRTANQFSPM